MIVFFSFCRLVCLALFNQARPYSLNAHLIAQVQRNHLSPPCEETMREN